MTICLECCARCLIMGYEAGFRLDLLERSLPQIFEISAEKEAEIIATKRDELAAKYQARLISARDPDPTPDEGERTSLGVTVTKLTKRRIEALAEESGMTTAEWIRRAIWLAFEITKA